MAPSVEEYNQPSPSPRASVLSLISIEYGSAFRMMSGARKASTNSSTPDSAPFRLRETSRQAPSRGPAVAAGSLGA